MDFFHAVIHSISKRSWSSLLLSCIKHVLDILTEACDCVIHFILSDTVSMLVCETLHAPYHSTWKFHKKKVVMRHGPSIGLVNLSLPLRLLKQVGIGREPNRPLVVSTRVGLFSGACFFCQPSTSFLSRPVILCPTSCHPVVIGLHPSSKTS
jgi:hypothetical protein